jgi:enoyl-CoA hydratase/carnithine racemase
MPQHTRGPWIVASYEQGQSYVVESARHYRVCEVGDLNESPQNAANARLIAAAPDLLAACRAALDYDAAILRHAENGQQWVQGDDLDALYDAWASAARHALAKAVHVPEPAGAP